MNDNVRPDEEIEIQERNSPARSRYRRVASGFMHYFVAPVLTSLIGLFLVTVFTDWLDGPRGYFIYFVGNEDDSAMNQIYNSLTKYLREYGEIKIDGIPVGVKRIDDGGDPDRAEMVARDIAQQPDVLVVVGHGFSSTSKRALPQYLAQEPMIPVILVMETNPDLLPSHCDPKGFFCPVLRLSPTDDIQAQTAVDAAIAREANSFLVVKDSENSVYSNYLSDQIVQWVHKRQKSVVLSTTNSAVLLPETLRSLNVDWVFFVGGVHKALVLIRQIRLYDNGAPRRTGITLTDASADPLLMTYGLNDVNGVYITDPRSAAEIGNNTIDYTNYGRDTAWLLTNMLAEVKNEHLRSNDPLSSLKNKLGLHRVDVARRTLVKTIEDVVNGEIQSRFGDSPSGKLYDFDRDNDGRLNDGKFHVWVIRDSRFVATDPM